MKRPLALDLRTFLFVLLPAGPEVWRGGEFRSKLRKV